MEEQAASLFRVDMIAVRMWQGVDRMWIIQTKEEEEGGKKSPVQFTRNGAA